jgi:ankyrin repeat protein
MRRKFNRVLIILSLFVFNQVVVCMEDQPPSYEEFEEGERNRLIKSIKNQDLETINEIISKNPSIANLVRVSGVGSSDGNTPLHIAASQRNKEIVAALITLENINMQNEMGWTPLDFALEIGDPGIILLLESKGAKGNKK